MANFKPKDSEFSAMEMRNKRKSEGKKENITFRITKAVLNDFRKACDKRSVVFSGMVEDLMRAYISYVQKGAK